MPVCAFLTLEDPTGFVMDDELAMEPFRRRGWEVAVVPWRQAGLDWSSFGAVVIRSTWDYHRHLEEYLAVLTGIARAGTALFNPLDLVRWSVSKTYLSDLAARGVPVVPTVRKERLEPGQGRSLFAAVGAREIVIKPVVGANAEGVFRVHGDRWPQVADEVEVRYAGTPFFVQPLARAVLEEGEYSLIYFDGVLSHAVLKKPRSSDFRVQEEHGATVRPVEADAGLRRAGARAVAALPSVPLYARVDLVRANGGDGFWLMELELVEPSLYLRMDPGAPERFASAFERQMTRTR